MCLPTPSFTSPFSEYKRRCLVEQERCIECFWYHHVHSNEFTFENRCTYSCREGLILLQKSFKFLILIPFLFFLMHVVFEIKSIKCGDDTRHGTVYHWYTSSSSSRDLSEVILFEILFEETERDDKKRGIDDKGIKHDPFPPTVFFPAMLIWFLVRQ